MAMTQDVDLEQTREMAQNAAKQAAKITTPSNEFKERLAQTLGANNTQLRNAAIQAGNAVSGQSVLSNVVVKAQTQARSAGTVTTTRGGKSKLAATAPGSTGGLTGNSGAAGTGSSGTSSTNDSSIAASGTTSADGSTSSAQLLQATQQMQELNQNFNLQYLQLQENMQSENRDFSSVSNVMKTKSTTASNSISNIK